MPVEFLGIGATNDGTETDAALRPRLRSRVHVALARAHEDHGWDRVLTAYGSGSPDPAQAAAYRLPHRRLQLLLAHRPNVDSRRSRRRPSPRWTRSAAGGSRSTSSPAATTTSSGARATR